MKLGVHLGTWSRGFGAEEQLALAQEAERLGFDSIWIGENYGSEGTSVLGWLAAHTKRMKLGSAVLQIPARTPALTAMAAATLDHLSGGRLVLGLGLSGPQVTEGWHGQSSDRPLRRTREYVEIVRAALTREPLSYPGEVYPLPHPDGRGKTLKLIIKPVQERVPIYLGSLGPKAIELAAEIADGWIPIFLMPERMDVHLPALERGVERAGRSLSDLEIAPLVDVAVGEDVAACRNALRPLVAMYVGGAGSREQNFYNHLVRRYGFEAAAEQVQELYLSGERAEAVAAVPDELMDAITLCGPPDRIRNRLEAYSAAGVGMLIVNPAGATIEDRLQTLRALQHLAEQSGVG